MPLLVSEALQTIRGHPRRRLSHNNDLGVEATISSALRAFMISQRPPMPKSQTTRNSCLSMRAASDRAFGKGSLHPAGESSH